MLASIALVSLLGGWTEHTTATASTDKAVAPDASFVARPLDSLATELADVRGELASLKLQLERSKAIVTYSAKYQIPADLAGAIYDIARSEDIDPSLAFRLVKIESNFKANARSGMNAIGYTQLQLGTARFYRPGVTENDLFNRDVNLRIGLRFLSDLLAKFDNDVHLALLAYNRGPARIEQILASGGDPKNGYSEAVLRGYRPPAPER